MIDYLTPDESKPAWLFFLTIPFQGSPSNLRERTKWGNNMYLVRKGVMVLVAFANSLIVIGLSGGLIFNALRPHHRDAYDLVFPAMLAAIYPVARDTARLIYYLKTGNVIHETKRAAA